MAKNYVTIYENGNDSIALEQKIYLKEETVRGQVALPLGVDFIYHTAGSVNFTQPVESSPHKSGRHNTGVIEQKTTTDWNLTTFFNIDTLLGAAATAEIDPSARLLHKSMFGKEDLTSGAPVYTSADDPSTTFTIMEIGDLWAKQAPGAFCESSNMTFPGDGDAQAEWGGSAKTSLLVGIGKSITDNNTFNTVTLEVGEGKRFPVGSQVMIVLDTNVKSADTVADTARTVTAVVGDVVTIDGAVLAASDGSVNPIYLVYYEPEGATAINNPQTGLDGSMTIAGFATIANCVRSMSVNSTNQHELQDFCYGEKGLGGRLFVPGGRLMVEVSMELNLNQELVEFLNTISNFDGENIDLILGDVTSRYLQLQLPKVIFPVPEISVGDSGTIPVTFSGNSYQSALDAADEITISYL